VVGLEWYQCSRLKPVWLGWSGICVAGWSWCGWVGVVSVLQAEAGVVVLEWYQCCRLKSATPKLQHTSTQEHTTNVVIQQNSRRLRMMDILMSETCWAHKKWNKITSDIKLVFYSSAFQNKPFVTEISSMVQRRSAFIALRNFSRCS